MEKVLIGKDRQRYDELVRAMRFLAGVSAKIHGLLDESKIYKTVVSEFRKSGHYSCSILLLTDDKSHLAVEGLSANSDKLKGAARAAGLRRETFRIDLAGSSVLRRVVKQGKIVRIATVDVIKEVLPKGLSKLVSLFAKAVGYERTTAILPLCADGNIIGVIGITPPEMFDEFVPSAQNFVLQLSNVLQLAQQATERERAVEALAQSEAKLSAAIMNSPIPTAVGGSDGSIVSFNKALEKLIGYSQNEIRDVNDWAVKLYPEKEYRDFVNKNIGLALEGEKQSTTEFTITCKDGTKKVVDFSTSFFAEGLIIQMLDVTAQRKAESALRENELMFSSFLEHSPVYVFFKDKDLRSLRLSRNFEQMLGMPLDRALGKPMNALFPSELARSMEADDRRIMEKRKPVTVQEELQGRNYETIKFPILKDGDPFMLAGITMDITERRRAEQVRQATMELLSISNAHTEIDPLLQDVVARLQEITGCSAAGIRVLDSEGNIPYQAYQGFSDRFFELESPLSISSDSCMCINVMKGDTDPRLSYYTSGGSFYMNGTTCFLATVSEKEKGETRNECNRAGYESVALVPIRSEGKLLGLIHVADPHENKVPLGMVELLEACAVHLGETIGRIRARELVSRRTAELRESEDKFTTIFEAESDALLVIDPGTGKILEANSAAVVMFGYNVDELRNLPIMELSAEPAKTRKSIADQEREVPLRYFKRKRGSTFPAEITASYASIGGRKVNISAIRDITGRKRAEDALAESAKLLSESQKASNVGSWVWDMGSGQAWWSEQLFEIYGRDPKLGVPSPEFSLKDYHADDRQAVRDAVEIALKSKGAYHIDFRIFRENDGEERWVHSRGQMEMDQNNQPSRLIGTSQDITEYKRAEELLRIQRDLGIALGKSEDIHDVLRLCLRAGMQAADMDCGGIYTVHQETGELDLGYWEGFPDDFAAKAGHYEAGSPNAQIVMAGSTVYTVHRELGTALSKAEEREGLKALALIPVKHANRVVGCLNLASHTHEQVPQHARHTLEIIGSQIGDAIAARNAENALRESEEKFRKICETSHELISLSDMKGITTWANQAWKNAFGEIKKNQSNPVENVHPQDAEKVSRVMSDLVSIPGYEVTDLQYRYKSQEHGYMCLESSARMVALGGEKFLCVSARNVTEQMRMEEELRHSEKMQAIGQLAGGIAHDFNNQLGGIMGNADLLRAEAEGNPEFTRYADSIIKGTERAADLTGQLLAFARKGKYLSVPVNAHKVIGDVVSLLYHSIGKKITIHQDLRANPPTVWGDPTQLQNALLNMGINARDAMPDGGQLAFGTNIASIHQGDSRLNVHGMVPGKYLQLWVSDTGIGMDEDTKRRIFDPFFTTKRIGEGTGMGLASVYGTVKNHKGYIDVVSSPGKGATFQVFLPLSESEEAGSPKSVSDSVETAPARILLVDDEEGIRETTSEVLRASGFKVVTCKDGKEALAYYRKSWKDVDLVILDMVMPRLGGKETFVAMRGINPGIRAILSSGYSIDGEARTILDEGVLLFLQKPFRSASLVRAVTEALVAPAKVT